MKLTQIPYIESDITRRIEEVLGQAVSERGRAFFAISGGRSPGWILSRLASQLNEEVLKKTTLMWLDERALPVGHEDRNDRSTLASWNEGGPTPGKVLPMPAEMDHLDEAAQLYQETLEREMGSETLDLCLMGIGEDGHFASLFPNHALLKSDKKVDAISDSPKAPSGRLTMTLPFIAQAKKRFVLAMDSSKVAICKKIEKVGVTREIPVSLLPSINTLWFVGKEAAN